MPAAILYRGESVAVEVVNDDANGVKVVNTTSLMVGGDMPCADSSTI